MSCAICVASATATSLRGSRPALRISAACNSLPIRSSANATSLTCGRFTATSSPGSTSAGELRTVVLAKTDLFCLPEHIESSGAEIFGKLAEEDWLRGLGRESFIDRLAHYLGDVNALHPFRDGNGRAQRAFFAQLAADAGFQLDWQLVDPQRNTDASVAAMQGDEAPMRNLLDEIVKSIA